MKIDLVYLWVDGNDPKWRAKKDAALRAAGQTPKGSADHAARFQDNDELKYSLRSVEKFAPWINHIWIITDGQRPKWLANNPRVSIVDHSEIIPAKFRPTFNSSNIELFLQNVPGLSEHFLLANDDFFFGRPVEPDFFFDAAGDPIVIIDGYKHPARVFKRGAAAVPARAENFTHMRANSLKYAFDKTGIMFHLRFKHAFTPMRKSYLTEIINGDYDFLTEASATTFRENKGIQRIIFPLIDFAKGRTALAYQFSRRSGRRILYGRRVPADAVRPVLNICVALGLARKNIIDSNRKSVIEQIEKQRPEMFCLNYISSRDDGYKGRATKFLEESFPEKSEYEK